MKKQQSGKIKFNKSFVGKQITYNIKNLEENCEKGRNVWSWEELYLEYLKTNTKIKVYLLKNKQNLNQKYTNIYKHL